MSDKETGGQAFPLGANEYGGHGSQGGMSLRDYFAAKAMQGALSAASGEKFADALSERSRVERKSIAEVLAIDAYITADAMLAARSA